ncbi:MAG TPA: hypothetical protein VLT13_16390 [Bacteroidota bacterium]|nr:hypothetical protein [Bacteroidota bacterium]
MIRKTVSSGGSTAKRRTRTGRGTESTLDLIQEGVRRFILNDASMGDFHKAIRAAAKLGELSPNPLSGTTLRRIVKEAIKEKKGNNSRKAASTLKMRKDVAHD